MKNWFGPRGAELLSKATDDGALEAFELGVLLVNHGSRNEGSLFLKKAGELQKRLVLDFEPFREGDLLYGGIVKDIYRRVALAYEEAERSLKGTEWRRYASDIDGAAPIAMLLKAQGRHAGNRTKHAPFDPNQVQQIESFYWRAYASDPSDTSFTQRHRLMLTALLADQQPERTPPPQAVPRLDAGPAPEDARVRPPGLPDLPPGDHDGVPPSWSPGGLGR